MTPTNLVQEAGAATETLVKYRGQLERFKNWCEAERIQRANKFCPMICSLSNVLAQQCGLSRRASTTKPS